MVSITPLTRQEILAVAKPRMDSVLISIRRPYTDKIFSGEKTVEVRKSNPAQMDWPFKVLVYETMANGGAGAVIGQFVCPRIDVARALEPLVFEGSCLTGKEFTRYGQSGLVYGWNISRVCHFPEQKPLSDYGVKRAPQSWMYLKAFERAVAE